MLLARRIIAPSRRLLATRAGVGLAVIYPRTISRTSLAAPDTATAGLSAKQRYLFDLNGFPGPQARCRRTK